MMDAALIEFLKAVPYIIPFAWITLRQDKRIDNLLDSQKWLIEQLMALHPPQDSETPPPPPSEPPPDLH